MIKNERVFLKNDSRGVALLTVLLVTALTSSMLYSLLYRQEIDFQRAENIFVYDQSFLLLQSVTAWAQRVLSIDTKENDTDSFGDSWAMGLIPTEIEDLGSVAMSVEDLQGRFNVNNLISKNEALREYSRRQFTRLLALCGLSTGLVDPVVDWLDADSSPRPFGAEDPVYRMKNIPYLAYNGRLCHPDELRLVHGFGKKEVMALIPYVSGLPKDTPINVNTASATLLASLSSDISLAEAEEFVRSRPLNGYKTVAEFIKDSHFTTLKPQENFLSVSSDFFMVHAHSSFENEHLALYSTLARSDNNVVITQQSIGTQ